LILLKTVKNEYCLTFFEKAHCWSGKSSSQRWAFLRFWVLREGAIVDLLGIIISLRQSLNFYSGNLPALALYSETRAGF
jgi:hypothetical protein